MISKIRAPGKLYFWHLSTSYSPFKPGGNIPGRRKMQNHPANAPMKSGFSGPRMGGYGVCKRKNCADRLRLKAFVTVSVKLAPAATLVLMAVQLAGGVSKLALIKTV